MKQIWVNFQLNTVFKFLNSFTQFQDLNRSVPEQSFTVTEETIGKFQFSINMSAIFLFQEREQEDEQGSILVDTSEPDWNVEIRDGDLGNFQLSTILNSKLFYTISRFKSICP